MTKDEVRTRLLEIGIIPVLRASSSQEAQFAADALAAGGIPIVEVTTTVSGGIEILRDAAKNLPKVLVGAGNVLGEENVKGALEAGAEFVVTPGLDLRTIEYALREKKFIMTGALTPTEVITAWQAGSDFIKVFPCAQVGGPQYIRALLGPFPDVLLVPTGGVNLRSAAEFITAGAVALGVGAELVQKAALKSHAHDVIRDAARKFLAVVQEARTWAASGDMLPARNPRHARSLHSGTTG
jgi:2-dehydro-3-deoxyphosphogluconate aldolase / (4S)-4-hydroxy-2-oxoglutarate aldolase